MHSSVWLDTMIHAVFLWSGENRCKFWLNSTGISSKHLCWQINKLAQIKWLRLNSIIENPMMTHGRWPMTSPQQMTITRPQDLWNWFSCRARSDSTQYILRLNTDFQKSLCVCCFRRVSLLIFTLNYLDAFECGWRIRINSIEKSNIQTCEYATMRLHTYNWITDKYIYVNDGCRQKVGAWNESVLCFHRQSTFTDLASSPCVDRMYVALYLSLSLAKRNR